MYFGYINSGYCWAFPKKDFVTMGICGLPHKNKRSLKELFSDFLGDTTKGDVRELMAEMKGFPLPYHNYAGPVSKGNVLLTGDAAGLLDPFTGEGIYFAVLSGRLAAEAILSPGDTPEVYKRAVKNSIGRVLGKAYDVRFLFFHPLLRSYSINKLRGNNKYCRYFFELLSEDNNYHNFFMKTLKDRGKYPPE
jgi:flavin-dependent dehydrogenase